MTSTSTRSVAAARALPAPVILKALAEPRRDFEFQPSIDGELLPEPNSALYRAGRFNDTPVLIGSNSDEGHRNAPPAITAAMLRDESRHFACPDADAALLAHYPLESDAQAPRVLEMLFRDGGPAWTAWTWARWQARKGRGGAYLYYFDFPMPRFPNGAGLPRWPRFDERNESAMVFDRTASARPLPNLERLRAFDHWSDCAWGARGF